MYFENRLSETGGRKITEPQLQTMCIQAEARSVISSPQLTVEETKQKPAHSTVAWYEYQLQEVMEMYRESVLHLLKQGQTMDLLPSYEKLRNEHFPIMTFIATLIQHLGGNEISIKSLTNRTHQAEEEALQQYSNAKQTKILPENLDRSKDKEIVGSETPRDLIPPPDKPKTSLKVGKFFPLFSNSIPPQNNNGVDNGEVEDNNEPGIYSKILDGAGDGTHYITTSFVKNNDKIKDQLLTHFKYFLKLMCENIEGLKSHPVNTERKLPILTSASDGNIPTTGTKIRDYFFCPK